MEIDRVPIYKRIIAFIIDFAVVALISTLIMYVLPENKKYQEVIDNNRILQEKLVNKEITNKEYVTESMNLTYDSYKTGTVENIVTISVMIIYFTCFLTFNHGKTLGKMAMKYEIKTKDNKDPNILQSLGRTVLITRVFGDIITIILVYSLSRKAFVSSFNYVDMVITTLWLSCPFFSMFREDGRGVHDLIVGTKTVNRRKHNEDDIVEAKIEEKKEEPKVKKENKTKTNKKNNKKK